MELTPAIKSYEWGRFGLDSEVGRLAVANEPECRSVCAAQPNAEWWIGDHVSGPATVKSSGEPLSALIARDPTLIGATDDPEAASNKSLPFLLKVLSIHKALSIQVHPSKVAAGAPILNATTFF